MRTVFCTRRSALRTICMGFLSLLLDPFDAWAMSGQRPGLPSIGGRGPDPALASSGQEGPCELERRLIDQGLIDVRGLDPTLIVDLKYARSDNVMGENVYGRLRKCYLRPEPARMLVGAQAILKRRAPGHSLLLLDGVRPRSVQRRMWALVVGTPMQPYVANPARGSMHNYGAAVDLTIAGPDGAGLDMGTSVDHFGILAQPREEERFLKAGRLTADQVANRRFLREVMAEAGFRPLAIEWWHFDAYGKEETRRRYGIIE